MSTQNDSFKNTKLKIRSSGRPPQHPYEVKKLVELYQAGKTCRQIAKECGISTSTVWRNLRRVADQNG